MIQRATTLALGATILLAAAGAWANDYVVQVGALERPSEPFAERARTIGAVSTSQTDEGMTRYRVGPFSTKVEAEQAKAELRAAGYEDAFVLQTRRSSRTAELPPVSAGPESAADEVAALPEDLRRRVVYLDGVLHVKEGDRFTKLSEYPYGEPAGGSR